MKIQLSTNQLVLAAAVFLTATANLAFFRNVADTLGGSPSAILHLVLLGVVLLCTLCILLGVFSFRRTLKPMLAALFMLSALTAYFMDSYNVVIDGDMVANVLATDAAESRDLLTLSLCGYIVLLGVLPSVLLARVEVTALAALPALRARLKLVATAALVSVLTVASSSAFFISFVREHKVLRYYANPLTPLYGLYEIANRAFADQAGEVESTGGDARIPEADIDRELVIMVVGETARSDRFSLNGYQRETNPELGTLGVISFSQVSSCGTSTATSVPCMFSVAGRADFSKSVAEYKENLLDVLVHAGVHLLWRDNNSGSKGVADRITSENFREPELNPLCDVECRDEGMLSSLQEYIDGQRGGDILIVLHQMGSHGPAYSKRYPPRFKVFTPTCEHSQLDQCTQDEIGNSYDNTIVYTDHFLARVIDLLRVNDNRFETAMVYISDHGESLGENGLYLHGLPYWMAPDAQTHVPMILWFGKNFDAVDVAALKGLNHAPVSHDYVFHTMLGMFEISSDVYQADLDLLQQSRDMTGTAREYQ